MAGNSFGNIFCVTTFGESHGESVGAVIDGCPPKMKLSAKDIQKELDRRKPGQSGITSSRNEKDRVEILSGVFEGKTTGTPIFVLVRNKDAKTEDYAHLKNVYRPSHADYTYDMKYGIRDWRGSGRASARETLARVAAGAIAKKYLSEKLKIEFLAYVKQVGEIRSDIDPNEVIFKNIESNIIRCPDKKIARRMIDYIKKNKEEGDSVGGIIAGVIKNVPPGLGEPVFDKLSSDLGKAMLSIPAARGFDLGSGFEGARSKGSENNDSFYVDEKSKVRTKTNHSGGIQGGISNGEPIHFRVAFKPISTIGKIQTTIGKGKKEILLKASGRHDSCVLPRAVPIVEAMAAIVIMDHHLRHKAQNL
jgi:chorismate synthase